MTRVVPGRRWWALLLAPLLMVALAARLLAPEGWMPTRGGVTLCSGTAMPAMPGHAAPEKKCDFAVAAPVAPPPPVLAWSAPVPARAPLPVVRPLPAPGRGLAAPPPFATGPPAFA